MWIPRDLSVAVGSFSPFRLVSVCSEKKPTLQWQVLDVALNLWWEAGNLKPGTLPQNQPGHHSTCCCISGKHGGLESCSGHCLALLTQGLTLLPGVLGQQSFKSVHCQQGMKGVPAQEHLLLGNLEQECP